MVIEQATLCKAEGDNSLYAEMWAKVRSALQDIRNEPSTVRWLDSLSVSNIDSGHIVLIAPTRFAREWIKNNLASDLLRLWKEHISSLLGIKIIVGRKLNSGLQTSVMIQDMPLFEATTHIDNNPQNKNNLHNSVQKTNSTYLVQALRSDAVSISTPVIENNENDTIDCDFEERYTFENFIVGQSNQLAFSASQKVASGKGINFNPLFLYSGVGLGKTHLMHSIAWSIKKRSPKTKVVYLSAEQFMYRFVKALRDKTIEDFKTEFRSIDVLLIDDLQFISGKDKTQEEFFHTFNALIDSKKQIVISADRCPSDMDTMEERFRSRLSWGLVVDINPTDYELRVGILESKIALLQKEYPEFQVPRSVVEFLAQKISTNVRELEGAINRVAAHATFVSREVTVNMVQDVVSDLLRGAEKKITLEEIQRKTCDFYGIKLNDMLSSRRDREVARPRQIAMYLAKTMTSMSLPDIGKKFAGKDHTTVMHAIKKVEEFISDDVEFSENIATLKNIIRH